MKYKKTRLSVKITLEGIPNGKEIYEKLYEGYLIDKPYSAIRKLLELLEEWYPNNKKRATHNQCSTT